jgi:hypothetical protein
MGTKNDGMGHRNSENCIAPYAVAALKVSSHTADALFYTCDDNTSLQMAIPFI